MAQRPHDPFSPHDAVDDSPPPKPGRSKPVKPADVRAPGEQMVVKPTAVKKTSAARTTPKKKAAGKKSSRKAAAKKARRG